MHTQALDTGRRDMLKAMVGVAALAGLGVVPAQAAAIPPAATGKPGDFDFLSGEWRIKNRRRKGAEWDEFDSEATVHGILKGVVSVEELRIPARNFSGMGLRALDIERKLWADFWVNAKSGVVGSTPSWGSFTNGVGTWDADDVEDGKPVIYRGQWDQITPTSCRWFQAASHDDGKTWKESWVMHWTRV
jgi:hypothetical protein